MLHWPLECVKPSAAAILDAVARMLTSASLAFCRLWLVLGACRLLARVALDVDGRLAPPLYVRQRKAQVSRGGTLVPVTVLWKRCERTWT